MSDNDSLTKYFEGLEPAAQTIETWGDAMVLECTSYMTTLLPPLAYVSSVRAVMTNKMSLFVFSDPDGSDQIIPGGRIEDGENVMQTLEREIGEETGWTIKAPILLGIMHFRHQQPKPRGYRYPYPDFLHLIYRVDADQYVPERKVVDPYVCRTRFLPLEEVRSLIVPKTQIPFLKAVVESMQAS
jgi:8-oxo-dGTP pyrophosphatase MutT (NUDIX family)